jgi:hypothetical protein
VTEESPDRLVIELPPTVVRWMAASGVVLGLTMVGLAVAFPWPTADLFDRVFPAVVGAIAALAEAGLAAVATTITVTLDRTANEVRLERRGWFAPGVRTELLAAVERAALETIISEGDTLYRVVLRLADGRTLPFTLGHDNMVRPKRAAVEAVNRFLGRPG